MATSIQANAATIEFSALELKARYEEPAMSGFGQCTVAFSANGQTGIVAALVYSNDVFMIKLLRKTKLFGDGAGLARVYFDNVAHLMNYQEEGNQFSLINGNPESFSSLVSAGNIKVSILDNKGENEKASLMFVFPNLSLAYSTAKNCFDLEYHKRRRVFCNDLPDFIREKQSHCDQYDRRDSR